MLMNLVLPKFSLDLKSKAFEQESDYSDKEKIPEFLGTQSLFEQNAEKFLHFIEKTVAVKTVHCPGLVVTAHEGFFTQYSVDDSGASHFPPVSDKTLNSFLEKL